MLAPLLKKATAAGKSEIGNWKGGSICAVSKDEEERKDEKDNNNNTQKPRKTSETSGRRGDALPF